MEKYDLLETVAESASALKRIAAETNCFEYEKICSELEYTLRILSQSKIQVPKELKLFGSYH